MNQLIIVMSFIDEVGVKKWLDVTIRLSFVRPLNIPAVLSCRKGTQKTQRSYFVVLQHSPAIIPDTKTPDTRSAKRRRTTGPCPPRISIKPQ